ncbi:aspartyl-phosphate phosphatase Spo0E family protein [Clostridium thailandense]|uniref:Aspartyl-phosphate phosphatase Spo0E family protein n=1 Tax=Clostridium thailandense TaxID=2794346 RepID=A0A949WU34_9CLOT|nr:aspartyl-phosphate phosphatase Spo0E family protein [Clostridium thailandense]MBV7276891.1 aspartyl-phosphate phosphatase Spo0E family protein [Clostridium thailandense]
MKNTQEYEYLISEIDKMRKRMYDAIERGLSLTDVEVVEVSQRLDSLLNDYNKSVQAA